MLADKIEKEQERVHSIAPAICPTHRMFCSVDNLFDKQPLLMQLWLNISEYTDIVDYEQTHSGWIFIPKA